MDFEANGMLPAGLHDYSVEQFITQFVDGFPTSQRRKQIADALFAFAREIFAYGIPFEFWIDGSYVTTKVNPNDADLALFFHYPDLAKLPAEKNVLHQKYAQYLDPYYLCAASPENQQILPKKVFNNVVNHRNYWRGQFGFDRSDVPKGIVRLSCDSLLEYLNRRES